MLVDFACIVRKHLECSGLVVVHCKNGRSRSPNVILAYMVLSHLFPNCTKNLTLSFATDWLTTAFREQRPTIASGSANFPNFGKFQNVIKALEMDVFVKAPWIGERIAENMARLTEASPSSPCRRSLASLPLPPGTHLRI